MSKCTSVLDSEKITEIRVKAKVRKTSPKDAPEPKSSDQPKQASAATPQSK